MNASFRTHLNQSVVPKLGTVGKYNGKDANFTCATNAGKVLIHNPFHSQEENGQAIQYLNINRKITALHAGKFNTSQDEQDILLVGTASNLLAYDVCNNSDVFYKGEENSHLFIFTSIYSHVSIHMKTCPMVSMPLLLVAIHPMQMMVLHLPLWVETVPFKDLPEKVWKDIGTCVGFKTNPNKKHLLTNNPPTTTTGP